MAPPSVRVFSQEEFERLNQVGILHGGVERREDGSIWWLATRRPAEPVRFTLEDTLAMFEHGILHPDEKLELWDGRLHMMSPIGSEHAATVDALTHFFGQVLGRRALVRAQGPIDLRPGYAPEPDLSLLRWRDDFYRHVLPGPNDVYLLVEVAHASLPDDRRRKLPEYAKAAIPEVWVVDLVHRVIEVHREPKPAGYAQLSELRGDELVAPAAFDDVAIRAADLHGEAPAG